MQCAVDIPTIRHEMVSPVASEGVEISVDFDNANQMLHAPAERIREAGVEHLKALLLVSKHLLCCLQ